MREAIAQKEKISIKPCGLILNKNYPVVGASPDGLTNDYVVEIKCPLKNKNFKNYVLDGAPIKRYMAQIQLQMYFADKQKGLFCLADENFETTNRVDIYKLDFNEEYCVKVIDKAMQFWKANIFPKLLGVLD